MDRAMHMCWHTKWNTHVEWREITNGKELSARLVCGDMGVIELQDELGKGSEMVGEVLR